MKEELQIDLLEVFVKHKVVSETVLRNEKIRIEYAKMKNDGIRPKEARRILAEKYFTSEKNLESILYGRKKENEQLEMINGS
jgi:hypothetical protein